MIHCKPTVVLCFPTDRRIVDPDDYATACLFQRAPSPQDPAFVHVHSEVVKRKRYVCCYVTLRARVQFRL